MKETFLADLHVHSSFSDGELSVSELVDLYGRGGFGAIAITDHLCDRQTPLGRAAGWLGRTLTETTFPVYRATLEVEAARAWRDYRLVLIPGFEATQNSVFNRRSAHVLALGVMEFLPPEGEHRDIADLARLIRFKGGVAIAAHPVSTRKLERQTYHLWDRRQELGDAFDAWEVASGPHLFDEVLRSDLPKIASSDLHRPEQLRAWKTEFSCERSQAAIFEAIRRQEVAFKFYDPGNGLSDNEGLPTTATNGLMQHFD